MSGFLKFLIVIMGILLSVSLFSYPFINQISAVENKREIKINNQILTAEAAATDASRTQGLSGRPSIGVNEGMLFIFDSKDKYGFWMKDMKFPIDIVWIRDNVIIGYEKNVDPQIGANLADLKIYYPPLPVNMVLELQAGRVDTLRAKFGDKVFIRPLLLKLPSKN